MQLLGIFNPFIRIFELLDFLKKLRLGLDVGKHFFADQHLIENETSTPDITFLIILFQFKNLRGSIERSTGSFGHLDFYISGQTEVSNFKFFVLI